MGTVQGKVERHLPRWIFYALRLRSPFGSTVSLELTPSVTASSSRCASRLRRVLRYEQTVWLGEVCCASLYWQELRTGSSQWGAALVGGHATSPDLRSPMPEPTTAPEPGLAG